MPATVTSITPRRQRGQRRAASSPRRPFRDNPRLILAGIVALVIALVALLAIASGTSRFAPDFLSEVVLYGLTVADLTMLTALVFVLARNVVKIVVERRRALPFARFRSNLVALLLGMTLVPTGLVLLVGSELIRGNIDRWFNAPMAEILSSANQIAADYYREQQLVASDHASRFARALAAVDLAAADVGRVRDVLTPDVAAQRVQMAMVYRAVARPASSPSLTPVVDVAAPTLPPGHNRGAVDRLPPSALPAPAHTPPRQTLAH